MREKISHTVRTYRVVSAGVPILIPPGVIADTSPGIVFWKNKKQNNEIMKK